jgi:hypothetical protein
MNNVGGGRGRLEDSTSAFASVKRLEVSGNVDQKWEYRLRWLDDTQNDLGERKGKRDNRE